MTSSWNYQQTSGLRRDHHHHHKRSGASATPCLLWDDNIVPIHLTTHPPSISTSPSTSFPPSSRSLPFSFSCCKLFLALIIVFALIGVIVVIATAAYLGVMTANLMDDMTNSEHVVGRLQVSNGDVYSEDLADVTTSQFQMKAKRYETLLQNILSKNEVLKDALKGVQVLRFRPGNLVVFFRLILDRRKALLQLTNVTNIIQQFIKTEINQNNKDIVFDLQSILISDAAVSKALQVNSTKVLPATSTVIPTSPVTTTSPTNPPSPATSKAPVLNYTEPTEVPPSSTTTTSTTATTTATELTTTRKVTNVTTSRSTTSVTTSKSVTQRVTQHVAALTSGVAQEIAFSLEDLLSNRDVPKEQRVTSSTASRNQHFMEANVGAYLMLKQPSSSGSTSSSSPSPPSIKLPTLPVTNLKVSSHPVTTNIRTSSSTLLLPSPANNVKSFRTDSLPEVVVQSGSSFFKTPKKLEMKEQPLPFSASSAFEDSVDKTNVSNTDNMRMFNSDVITIQDANEGDLKSVTSPVLDVPVPSTKLPSNGEEREEVMEAEEDVIVTTSVAMNAPLIERNYASCSKLSDFRCADGRGCVANFSRCNQMRDCQDNSDEQECSCADYLQAQFLQSKICDGVVDCWDYSDENKCNGCSPEMYVCQNSNSCIQQSQVCDSLMDCPFGDDEKHCLELSNNSSGHLRDNYYRSSGYLLMRKNGEWGQLCVDNFPKHYYTRTGSSSPQQLSLIELAKSVCTALTFEDFVTIERKRLPLFPRQANKEEMFYEINYLPNNINSTRPVLEFTRSRCRSREVVWIQCKQLECGIRPVAARARIVGGANSYAGSWPWQAAMYKNGDYMCGATLLNDQWLLSAAHCFFNEVDNYWTARLGMLRRGSQAPYEQIYTTSHIIIHPDYVKVGFVNDVALLKLSTQVKFSDYVRPVCHPSQTEESIVNGRTCTVIGWGQLQETGHIFPDTLQEVDLPIFDATECRKKTIFLQSYQITDNMFCAGYDRGGRDACLGDSGGPLICQETTGKWTLVGITSNGFGCARAWRPGIYTKVSNYLTWINHIMASTLKTSGIRSFCSGHRCELGKCLSANSVCNGYVECLDGSDERECNS